MYNLILNIVILMSHLIWWKGNSHTFWTVSGVKPYFKILVLVEKEFLLQQVVHIFVGNCFFFLLTLWASRRSICIH